MGEHLRVGFHFYFWGKNLINIRRNLKEKKNNIFTSFIVTAVLKCRQTAFGQILIEKCNINLQGEKLKNISSIDAEYRIIVIKYALPRENHIYIHMHARRNV